MENKIRITEKQWAFLKKLDKERYAPNLSEKLNEIVFSSKEIASELIAEYLKAPKKSESPEYQAILAERREQERVAEELARQQYEAKRQAEIDDCQRCKDGHPVPHFNCSFPNRVGHGRHCSADICL